MRFKKGGVIFYIISVLTVVLVSAFDRLLKKIVEQDFFNNAHLGWRYLALERFHNRGAAFSLPFQPKIILPIGFLFLIGLIIYTQRSIVATKYRILTVSTVLLIVFGSVSNAFDRVFYAYTIDYLRIFNGIINLADLQIVAGICGLIYLADKK